MKKLFSNLGFLILVAMVLGTIAGVWMKEDAKMLDPLGDIFIQLIKMLVVPLIFISVLAGTFSLGATKKAGKVAFITVTFMMGTSIFVGIIAAVLGTWFQPGSGIPPELIEAFRSTEETAVVIPPPAGFWETIQSFIPENPVNALATGNILQIILFCMLLGFGIGSLAGEKKELITKVIDGLLDALIWCIKIVMWTAPVGVFALMASATGTLGFDIFGKIGNLLWLDIFVLLIVWLIYLFFVHFFSNISVRHYLKAMVKPQIVALSTSSSLATLAINMKVTEEELGVSKETTAFVLPLGATINMTGNIVYYVLATLFFAQFYGIDISLSAYVAIIITATISAIGQAGVPGPTLTLFAVLIAGGVPIEGVPLLFAVDRIFDMLRTVMNVTGDTCCAAVVQKYVK